MPDPVLDRTLRTRSVVYRSACWKAETIALQFWHLKPLPKSDPRAHSVKAMSREPHGYFVVMRRKERISRSPSQKLKSGQTRKGWNMGARFER